MIILVGVAHIIDVAKPLDVLISHYSPGAVGIELDPGRYRALLDKEVKRNVPLPYRLLALMQRRMADQFDGEVGAEMLAAVDSAQRNGAQVVFVDTDAARLFDSLLRQMSFKERVLMFFSSFAGLFMSRKKVEKELQEFQENEGQYMDVLAKSYPTVKRVLIDERNEHMSKAILRAEGEHGSVLAVIGDGHVEGIRKLIAREDLVHYRLKDLQNLKLKAPTSTSEASFTFVAQA
ncbi:MAG: TraB domain-containing protein [Methanomassiliicoccales archaeon]|nr:TraB domain-containing protein [Methanomassiliicoccales archaeon]